MKKVNTANPPDPTSESSEHDTLQGYQPYPESEDIYNKFKEEKNLDPEDIPRLKNSGKGDNPPTTMGEESTDDLLGSNLDVPGSELDDEQEIIGNEDEENNYYSIGGDNHNNLDEDRDDLM